MRLIAMLLSVCFLAACAAPPPPTPTPRPTATPAPRPTPRPASTGQSQPISVVVAENMAIAYVEALYAGNDDALRQLNPGYRPDQERLERHWKLEKLDVIGKGDRGAAAIFLVRATVRDGDHQGVAQHGVAIGLWPGESSPHVISSNRVVAWSP